jgi:hypothetical protein
VAGFELGMGYALLEINSKHFMVKGFASIAYFGETELKGEIFWNGDVLITGYAIAEAHFDEGPLSLDFELDANVEFGITWPDWRFHADGRLYGKACCEIPPWGGPLSYDACVEIELGFDADINSDGTFRICANIGVDGYGFDVCMDFDNLKNPKNMKVKEIPIELVPKENRYYSDQYKKRYPYKFMNPFK